MGIILAKEGENEREEPDRNQKTLPTRFSLKLPPPTMVSNHLSDASPLAVLASAQDTPQKRQRNKTTVSSAIHITAEPPFLRALSYDLAIQVMVNVHETSTFFKLLFIHRTFSFALKKSLGHIVSRAIPNIFDANSLALIRNLESPVTPLNSVWPALGKLTEIHRHDVEVEDLLFKTVLLDEMGTAERDWLLSLAGQERWRMVIEVNVKTKSSEGDWRLEEAHFI
jgi:hypothetical protein